MFGETIIRGLLLFAANLRFELREESRARRKPFRVFDRHRDQELAAFSSREAAFKFREDWINQWIEESFHALSSGEALSELSDGRSVPALPG